MQKEARAAGANAEIVLAPEEGNLSHWVGHVRGPVDTPYEVRLPHSLVLVLLLSVLFVCRVFGSVRGGREGGRKAEGADSRQRRGEWGMEMEGGTGHYASSSPPCTSGGTWVSGCGGACGPSDWLCGRYKRRPRRRACGSCCRWSDAGKGKPPTECRRSCCSGPVPAVRLSRSTCLGCSFWCGQLLGCCRWREDAKGELLTARRPVFLVQLLRSVWVCGGSRLPRFVCFSSLVAAIRVDGHLRLFFFSCTRAPLCPCVLFSLRTVLPIPSPALSAILPPPLPPTQNGYFKIDVVVPPSYPLSPPNVRLLSKVFHPNVHPKSGEVCLDILKAAWSPAWTLASTARALIVLLGHPEPDSPLNCDAGNLLRAGDGRAFRSLARMYTKLCAGPPPEVAALQGDR